MRARFKLIDGLMPSAGIAVRVTSPNDYYLVRVSTFELRLSLLHIINGVPEEIAGVGERRYHARTPGKAWKSLPTATALRFRLMIAGR